MRRMLSWLVAGLCAAGMMAAAQQPQRGDGSAPGSGQQRGPRLVDPVADALFPPELVMQNQRALGLQAEQQTAIRAEMQKLAARVTEVQWQLSAEQETLASLLRQDRPSEKEVLAQLDKLLLVESEMRRAHIGAMVRLKNLLTPEQQARLRMLQRPLMQPRPGDDQRGPEDRPPPPEPRD